MHLVKRKKKEATFSIDLLRPATPFPFRVLSMRGFSLSDARDNFSFAVFVIQEAPGRSGGSDRSGSTNCKLPRSLHLISGARRMICCGGEEEETYAPRAASRSRSRRPTPATQYNAGEIPPFPPPVLQVVS